jgi:hypothetical protein
MLIDNHDLPLRFGDTRNGANELHHARLEDALRRRRAGWATRKDPPDSGRALGASPGHALNRDLDGADRDSFAQRGLEGLLPLVIAQRGREIEQCLEDAGARDAMNSHDARGGKPLPAHARSPRTLTRFGCHLRPGEHDAVEAMEHSRQPLGCDTTATLDCAECSLDRARLVGPFDIHPAFDPSPSTDTHTPPERCARKPQLPGVFRREQPAHVSPPTVCGARSAVKSALQTDAALR